VEKKKPTYDLASIQAEFSSVATLRITRTARDSAEELGITMQGVVVVIQSIARTHFYKSMTSHADHKVWQDVYHVPVMDRGLVLYVKFTVNAVGKLLISFKEK
jgi:motility quorum-sensing regulator/GCU-specific mRNA interferase toxin